MPRFSYKAKSASGEIQSATIEAENKTVVVRKLRQEGLFPIHISEVNILSDKKVHKKVSSRDISFLTRQLADLLHSGFNLSAALSTLQQQERKTGLKKMIQELYDSLQKGSSFADALNKYPNAFSSFYVNMVKVGEMTGKIDDAFARLADFKEKEDELASQVKSALAYPIFILSIGLVTVFVMITFFIPRLSTMMSGLGQALPLPTKMIIKLSSIMNSFWWLFAACAAALFIAAKFFYRFEKNRVILDGLLLRLPLINGLIQKVEITRFCYALGALLKNGVPMLGALGVVNLSMDNRVFRHKVYSFQEKIRKGSSLSKCLQDERIFPAMLVNMVAIGEESGELTEMLTRIAGTFETQVNRTAKTLVSFLEPILILFIGAVVAFIVFSMLLPVFQLNVITQ